MRKFIRFVLILVAILSVFPIYTRFKVAAAPIPPGVHLGGLDVSNLKDANEIRQHIERIYTEPIAVYFDDRRLALRPQDIDFQVDVEQMVNEAGAYLEGAAFFDIALREALGFDQKRRDVPIRFMLDTEKLRQWLATVAEEHNHGPQAPRLLPPTARWVDGASASTGLPTGYVGAYDRDWTWRAGVPGQTLNVEASIPAIVEALTRDSDRVAHLVLDESNAPAPTMQDLARELDSYLSNFPGFAAVYVQDLRTGEEATVDADVSFSGMSTLKIGIVSAIMQQLPNGIDGVHPDSDQVGQWIDYALGESNNYAANQLLAYLGDGDVTQGTQRFTAFMRNLGFENTYMQSGYDTQVSLPQIPTPGNQRTDWNTNPDSNLQSTTAEMGRTLAALYHCTQGMGLLLEQYPGDFTPEECESILYYMSHDEFQELLWAGLPRPLDGWIVHKHGFAFESHSNVALIWGPSGPYVLSVFLYRRGWMDWETSNSTMKTVSRITWNFFEHQREALDLPASEPVILGPPPGYIPIKDYLEVASTGTRK